MNTHLKSQLCFPTFCRGIQNYCLCALPSGQSGNWWLVCPGIQSLQFHECCLVVRLEPCKSSSRTTPGVPKLQYPFPFLELMIPPHFLVSGLFFQSLNQKAGASFTHFCHLLPTNTPAYGAEWQEKIKRK